MTRKTASEVREEASRMASRWADERMSCGDPEGADEFRDLSRAIRQIPLTKTNP